MLYQGGLLAATADAAGYPEGPGGEVHQCSAQRCTSGADVWGWQSPAGAPDVHGSASW